jgi:hypothetical protein
VVTLASGVTSTVPSIKYQWRLNGTNLTGATSATLTLSNLTTAQAGTYSVIASNFAGVITNICAALTVNPPLRLENMAWLVNRRFNCEIKGAAGELFALQASTDLKTWQTLLADQLISDSWSFTDTNAHLFNQRFYRVIPSIVLEPSLIWTNGATYLQITSKSSEPCILQTTTDLIDWSPVYTNSAFTPLQFLESRATNSPARFYRATLLP